MNVPDHCIEATTGSVVTLEEKESKLILNNPTRKEVIKVHVDGCVVTDSETPRCDYYYCHDNEQHFLELKGKCISHAAEQLSASLNLLKRKQYTHHAEIISSNNPLSSTEVQAFKKKFKKSTGIPLEVWRSPHEKSI